MDAPPLNHNQPDDWQARNMEFMPASNDLGYALPQANDGIDADQTPPSGETSSIITMDSIAQFDAFPEQVQYMGQPLAQNFDRFKLDSRAFAGMSPHQLGVNEQQYHQPYPNGQQPFIPDFGEYLASHGHQTVPMFLGNQAAPVPSLNPHLASFTPDFNNPFIGTHNNDHNNDIPGYLQADTFQRHSEVSGHRNSVEVVSPSSQYPPSNPLTGNDARPARIPIPNQNSLITKVRDGRVNKALNDSPSPGSGSSGEPAMVATASGPMMSNVVVPPRPKPGRKPMQQEDAHDRRRMQNRMAQRNFRDKRQQKLSDTMAEMSELKEEHSKEINSYKYENAKLQERLVAANRQILDLRRQLDAETQRRTAAENQKYAQPSTMSTFRPMTTPAHAATMGANNQDYAARTPPSDETMEIDFTGSWNQNKQSRMDFDTERDHCGFCTDVQNCACINSASKPEPVEPAPVMGAGNCALCLKDPARAQQCRDMAANAVNAGLGANAIPGGRKSCTSIVDDYRKLGSSTTSISNLFGGRTLNAYPTNNGAGYDISEQQAADALARLRRQSSKAEDDARKDSGI